MKNLWALIGRISYFLAWPVLYFYLKNSQRTRVIVQAQDRILFVKDWLGNGKWKFPGGGIHSGELISASACRELLEETAVKAKPEDLISAGTIINNSHGVAIKIHLFKLSLATAVELKKQKSEIIDIGWHRPVDLIKAGRITKTTKAILDELGSSFEIDT
ncbi:MAG: NUDIX hydrolase [Candidatus Saccharimonadales bacterium]